MMILGKPACACSRPAVASTRHPVQDTQHHSSCTHSTTIPMIPRTRAALMRPVRSKGVPMPLMLCAVLCIPLLLWLVLLRTAKPAVTPPARLLQKLKQQGLAGAAQQEQTASRAQSTGMSAKQSAAAAAGTFSWASTEHMGAAGRYLQDAVLNHKFRPAVPASTYVIDPEPHDMRVQHKKVSAYLLSPDFRAKVAARRAAGRRGIIINAGGPHLVASTIVTLKVLREVLNCSLPVELVWHDAAEMDDATLATIRRRWGPIIGVDLSSKPWPAHHRPKPRQGQEGWNQTKFLGKVMSLTTSSFASALLLDADSMPLANPEGLWSDASLNATGNLFWPDFWVSPSTSEHQELVFDMVGLKHSVAEELLSAGKGRLRRATESGQLLLDLMRHADVAEWALWINSFGDSIYKAVWGDKDTFQLAFAVAGKAHEFNQLQVPPGAALTWREGKLLIKATDDKQAGYQLAGMVQFDALAQPAFLHRTMNKFSWGGQAWQLELLTGPLPLRWVNYYLSQDSQGPTVGVPYDYVVPASAVVAWRIPAALNTSTAVGSSWSAAPEEACPAATFITYWRLREHAVPVGSNASLDAACRPFLQQLLGPSLQPYTAAQLNQHPELLAAGLTNFDKVVLHRQNPNPLWPAEEVPDSTPVLAVALDYLAPAVATTVSSAIAGSYRAMQWLIQHGDDFELLKSLKSF